MSKKAPGQTFIKVTKSFNNPSLAKQSMKDECDINQIMRKFEKNGTLEHLNTFNGQYGDFADAPQYHDAMNIMLDANSMFDTIPSKIRAQFENSPSKFLEFAQDPENIKEMREMGLAPYPQNPPAIDAQRDPPPAASSTKTVAPDTKTE